MSSFTHSIAMSVPFARSVAIAALMGSTMLAIRPYDYLAHRRSRGHRLV